MRANINNEQRRQRSRDEQAAPPEHWEDAPVNQCGKEVAESIALLQNSGEQTARWGWQRFHRERRTQAPFAAHPDPEQGPQQQKRPEIGRERSQQFDDRIENDVNHQREATAKSIAQPSKDKGTERAHHQGNGDGEGNLRNCSAEIMCDRDKDKGQEKEIERVQGPSKKTSDESVALCAAQRFEQTQRLHVGSASCHVERSRDISK